MVSIRHDVDDSNVSVGGDDDGGINGKNANQYTVMIIYLLSMSMFSFEFLESSFIFRKFFLGKLKRIKSTNVFYDSCQIIVRVYPKVYLQSIFQFRNLHL